MAYVVVVWEQVGEERLQIPLVEVMKKIQIIIQNGETALYNHLGKVYKGYIESTHGKGPFKKYVRRERGERVRQKANINKQGEGRGSTFQVCSHFKGVSCTKHDSISKTLLLSLSFVYISLFLLTTDPKVFPNHQQYVK